MPSEREVMIEEMGRAGYGSGTMSPYTLYTVVSVLVAAARGDSRVEIFGGRKRTQDVREAAAKALEGMEKDGILPPGFGGSEVWT